MTRFRRKPVEIEARKLTRESAADLAYWCGGHVVTEEDAIDPNQCFVGVNVPTLEGVVRASEGEYIVRGMRGEFFTASSDALHDLYEEI